MRFHTAKPIDQFPCFPGESIYEGLGRTRGAGFYFLDPTTSRNTMNAPITHAQNLIWEVVTELSMGS